MTLEQTRQLGIEFERRIQTMIPEKELFDKLDTETIYSFLNQYQDKYVHDIYRNLDAIPSGTKISAHVESVLQSLLKSKDITTNGAGVINATSSLQTPQGIAIMENGRSVVYPLGDDFYMYVRSVSKVSDTFSFRSKPSNNNQAIRVIPNELVSQNDAWRLVETPHDSLRILRRPAAVLSNNIYNDKKNGEIEGHSLTVMYDQYTTPLGIKVTYYSQPAHFDLMTSTACELPLDCFDDLVSGAVDLYVQYAAGAEANRRRQMEAAQQQARRNNNDDEE